MAREDFELGGPAGMPLPAIWSLGVQHGDDGAGNGDREEGNTVIGNDALRARCRHPVCHRQRHAFGVTRRELDQAIESLPQRRRVVESADLVGEPTLGGLDRACGAVLLVRDLATQTGELAPQRLELARRVLQSRLACPLHILDLGLRDAANVLDIECGAGPGCCQLGVECLARGIDLPLRVLAEIIEQPAQLGNLRFGGTPQFVGLLPGGVAQLRQLPLRLPPDLLGRLLDGACALRGGRFVQLFRVAAQPRFQLSTHTGQNAIECRLEVGIGSHGVL